MKYILTLLLLFSYALQAQVYRSVDEHGNVVYSDQPSEQAEEIELKQSTIYTPTPVVEPEVEAEHTEVEEQPNLTVPNYQVSVVSPEQNQAFWENSGTVQVSANVTPKLNAERGDKVIFMLDGKRISKPQSALSYTLNEVERGSHIVVVLVVDSAGQTLKRSKSTLFHLHRRSVAQ